MHHRDEEELLEAAQKYVDKYGIRQVGVYPELPRYVVPLIVAASVVLPTLIIVEARTVNPLALGLAIFGGLIWFTRFLIFSPGLLLGASRLPQKAYVGKEDWLRPHKLWSALKWAKRLRPYYRVRNFFLHLGIRGAVGTFNWGRGLLTRRTEKTAPEDELKRVLQEMRVELEPEKTGRLDIAEEDGSGKLSKAAAEEGRLSKAPPKLKVVN